MFIHFIVMRIVSWLDMFKAWSWHKKQCQRSYISLWRGQWACWIWLNLDSWHRYNVNAHTFHFDEDCELARYVKILFLYIKTMSTFIQIILIRTVSWFDMFKSWFLTEKQCQGLHISLWKGKWAGSICLNLNSWHKDNVNVHIFHCDEDTKRAQYVYILILDIKTKSTIIHFIVIRIVRWLNMFKSWFLTQK